MSRSNTTSAEASLMEKCPICGKPGDCLIPEQRNLIKRGIEQADRGELVYLGSFAEFAVEDDNHSKDSK
jgi:hypothetical protein